MEPELFQRPGSCLLNTEIDILVSIPSEID